MAAIYEDYTVIIDSPDSAFTHEWAIEYVAWSKDNLSETYINSFDKATEIEFMETIGCGSFSRWEAWYELEEDALLVKLRWG